MARLRPYLFFSNNCREAMEFYKGILGGELQVMTVGDSPMAEQMPELKDSVIHAALITPNFSIYASDMLTGDNVVTGNNMDVCLECDTKEEMMKYFEALSSDGKVTMEIKDEFFGAFGSCIDKYGISWMFQYGNEQQ